MVWLITDNYLLKTVARHERLRASLPPERRFTAQQEIDFSTLYRDRNGIHKHWINYELEEDAYYIFRCDICGLHFGMNPQKSGAKHLRSASQHLALRSSQCLTSEVGIGTFENSLYYLGIKVLNCDYEKMQLNNARMKWAIEHEGYVPSDAYGDGESRARAYDSEEPAVLLPDLQERYIFSQMSAQEDFGNVQPPQDDLASRPPEASQNTPTLERDKPVEIRNPLTPDASCRGEDLQPATGFKRGELYCARSGSSWRPVLAVADTTLGGELRYIVQYFDVNETLKSVRMADLKPYEDTPEKMGDVEFYHATILKLSRNQAVQDGREPPSTFTGPLISPCKYRSESGVFALLIPNC